MLKRESKQAKPNQHANLGLGVSTELQSLNKGGGSRTEQVNQLTTQAKPKDKIGAKQTL
jgi:hypothetical protein